MTNYPKDIDIEVINLLRRINIGIINLYKRLSYLEMNGKKGSDIFKKNLEELKSIINIENRFYTDKVEYFLYLFNFIDSLAEQIELVDECYAYENPEFVNFRIFNKAYTTITNNEKWLINKKGKKKLKNTFAKNNKINLLNLAFLQEEINNQNNKEVKMKLNEIKYFEISVYTEIEKNILANDFTIPEIQDIWIDFDDEMIQICLQCFNAYFNLIINYNDSYLNNPIKTSLIISIMCKLKTYLYLLPEENIKTIENNIEKVITINNLVDKEIMEQKKEIIKYLRNILKEVKKEVKKYRK